MYPDPPWNLCGYSVQTLQLVDINLVGAIIPMELSVVSVLPNKTLGGVYLSCYDDGSLLSYYELIVSCGLVRYGDKVGSWISHIYVDNADSVAGGREIWGLPKELAEFRWVNNEIVVVQNERVLMRFVYGDYWWSFLKFKQKLSGSIISKLDDQVLFFKGNFSGRWGLVKGMVEFEDGCPFGNLGLDKPWLTFFCSDLNLKAEVPVVIG